MKAKRMKVQYSVRADQMAEVYNFIVAFWTENGISPSRREICVGCTLIGDSAGEHVNQVIEELEKVNFVRRVLGHKKSRNIVVVGSKWTPPAEVVIDGQQDTIVPKDYSRTHKDGSGRE